MACTPVLMTDCTTPSAASHGNAFMKSFLDFGVDFDMQPAASPFLGGWLAGMAVFLAIYLAGRGLKRAGLRNGDGSLARLGEGMADMAMAALMAVSIVSAFGFVMILTVRP